LFRFFQTLFIFVFAFQVFSCASREKPLTPREVLKAYTVAFKKKDAARMQDFLSEGSLKLARESSAKEQRSLDEIILEESLFDLSKSEYKIRNETTGDDTASIEFQDAFGTWITIPFVREDNKWKIAKEKFTQSVDSQIDQSNRSLDEIINQGRRE
jgi:hypothetical protein